MNRNWLFAVGGVLVVFAAVAVWFFFPSRAIAPQPTVSEQSSEESNSATTSDSANISTSSPSRSISVLPSIAKGDIITSWNYEGYLNDNGPLEAKALQEIKDLKSKLGSDEDYSLYISIAQEYDHLGDGKFAYEYLSRAIALDTGETSGVGWHNIGVLMEKLGAYNTARIAHDQAVKIQPDIPAFQISRVEFMVYHFPKDTAGVEKAFKDAEGLLGTNDPTLLDLRKRWATFL